MAKGKYHQWLEPDGLIRIEGWARDGLNDEQIAHNMGITAKTLYEYKKRYSEISKALKKGKEVVDIEVENALLKRALGYQVKETRKEQDSDGKSKVVEITKHIAPDTTAAIFWLKNRKPEMWRDRKEVKADVTTEQKDPFKDMTKEELLKIVESSND